MINHRVSAPLRAMLAAAAFAALAGSPAHAAPQQDGGAPARAAEAGKPAQVVQTTRTPPVAAPGIVFVDVTPDTITSVRTAQNVVTRIALPRKAEEAICGDVFDPGSNTGTFVITRSGNDVFIKPLAAKGQTNLFIKTESEIYNFDLVVVPAAQAHRVVNINQPAYEQQIEQMKASARHDLDAERTQLEAEMADKLAERQRDADQKNADALAAEQKRLKAEAERRAGDLAARRIADGVMQGFNTVGLREHVAKVDPFDLMLDDPAYVFEGKIYLRFTLANRGDKDANFVEPRLVLRGDGQDKDKPVSAQVITGRGDFRAPAGGNAVGVIVFERPELQKGQRVFLVLRVEGRDRPFQIRVLE